MLSMASLPARSTGTTPGSETAMTGAQVSSVLAGWPALWRVAAVLTGVLPVRGALHGRPPFQHRLCSGPALAGLVVATLFTVNGISWLMPQALGWHQMQNILLTVLFELTIAVTWCSSVWLLVARGRKIPDMISKADEVLISSGHLQSQHLMKRRLVHLMLVVAPIWVAASHVWQLYNSGSAFSLGRNSLPYLFAIIVGITDAIYNMTLLSLSMHLMQMFSDVFDAISADLDRELHSTSVSHISRSTDDRLVDRQKRNHDSAVARVRVVCRPSGSAVEPPGPPPPPSSQADILVCLRKRYLAAADATASFSAVYVLPALGLLVKMVALVVANWTSQPAILPGWRAIWMASIGLEMTMFAVLLCLHGQRLEEAARRPALLLLRHPPRHPEAAAEAAHLVALVEALRPAAAATGDFSINIRLLVSVVAGFITYLVVLLQMV